jgi:hypothetical protein
VSETQQLSKPAVSLALAIVVAGFAAGCKDSSTGWLGGVGTANSKVAIPEGDIKTVREAYRAELGRDLGDKPDCVDWPKPFPHVVMVGHFAHDRGCMLEGLFIGRTWYGGGSGGAAAAKGLATRGWASASADERQTLAREWIDSVTHAFDGRFVRSEPTAFVFDDTPAFEPVQVAAMDDGGVSIDGWVELPSGMVWESAYHFVEYHFDGQGALTAKVSRRFAVDGQRIRDHEDAAKQQ